VNLTVHKPLILIRISAYGKVCASLLGDGPPYRFATGGGVVAAADGVVGSSAFGDGALLLIATSVANRGGKSDQDFS